jgi:hypothetical protein
MQQQQQHGMRVKTTLILSKTTQVYCNSNGYLYMCATCFDPYLVHPQACQ